MSWLSWLPNSVAPAPPPPWYSTVVPASEHLPLVGYMSSIGVLLALVTPSLTRPQTLRSALHLLLALVSLGFTWTYMIAFFERSFLEAALRANVSPRVFTTAAWLRDTSLFVEAWERVCSTARRWWWSEQLCAWTAGPFTIFLERESRRRNIKKPLAFMLIGQLVAISVAQNLFAAALALARPGRTLAAKPQGRSLAVPPARAAATGPSWVLAASVLGSLATVGFTPATAGIWTFLPNLLVMHVLLLAPLVPSAPSSTGPPVSYATLYLASAAIALGLRVPTYAALLPTLSVDAVVVLGREAVKTLLEHPAQTSISYDVVWATASFALWMLVEYGARAGRTFVGSLAVLGLVLATPAVGIATTGGLFLAWRERWPSELLKED